MEPRKHGQTNMSSETAHRWRLLCGPKNDVLTVDYRTAAPVLGEVFKPAGWLLLFTVLRITETADGYDVVVTWAG